MKLPSPSDIEGIKRFLTESSGMWVEGVEFGKPASGISIKVTYRNFEDETKTQYLECRDTRDFQEATLIMSDVLDQISGVAMALMQRKKARLANA